MGTFNLFEFMLAAHEGIEQGLEGTEHTAQELALEISEVRMAVPFTLLFRRDSGFRVMPTGTPWVSRPPLNLARINIHWRLR